MPERKRPRKSSRKRERWAKQEAQRAAKAAKREGGGGAKGGKGSKDSGKSNNSNKSDSLWQRADPPHLGSAAAGDRRDANAGDPGKDHSSSSNSSVRVSAMFSHLKPYLRTPPPSRPRRFASRGAIIHPAFSRVGLMFSQAPSSAGMPAASRCCRLAKRRSTTLCLRRRTFAASF